MKDYTKHPGWLTFTKSEGYAEGDPQQEVKWHLFRRGWLAGRYYQLTRS